MNTSSYFCEIILTILGAIEQADGDAFLAVGPHFEHLCRAGFDEFEFLVLAVSPVVLVPLCSVPPHLPNWKFTK